MRDAEPLSTGADWIRLRLHVVPGARTSELAGLHGTALKLKVRAPARDGAANKAVLDAVRELCGVRSDQVVLERGHASREKVVLIEPLAAPELRRVLEVLAQSGYTVRGAARSSE